jgi:hypothetical protein
MLLGIHLSSSLGSTRREGLCTIPGRGSSQIIVFLIVVKVLVPFSRAVAVVVVQLALQLLLEFRCFRTQNAAVRRF